MHRARLPLAVSLLAALGACATPALPPQHVTDVLPGRGLEAAHPADVAVAEVVDKSGRGVPTGAMRQALYAGLVDRLYSPVRLEYADKQWTEASFGAAGVAEAVLEVTVTKWDPTHVPQRGIVLARAEGRLLDAERPDGTPLWAVGVTRRLDLGGPAPAPGWEARAAALLAAELLAELPQRDPVQAHRDDAPPAAARTPR